MTKPRHAWVYILASRKNGTLYVGVTTDLRARMGQHKAGICEGFTMEHRVTALVYFEELHDVRKAIAQEKALKGWSRRRKITLIETGNPDWDDLAAAWFEGPLDPSLRSG